MQWASYAQNRSSWQLKDNGVTNVFVMKKKVKVQKAKNLSSFDSKALNKCQQSKLKGGNGSNGEDNQQQDDDVIISDDISDG